MVMMKISLLLVMVSLIATSSSAARLTHQNKYDDAPPQCIPMSSVTTLALENTKTTTRLRTGNVPKLQCVGNCPSEAAVSNVHCTRQGMDDLGNPTWRCVPEFAISSQVTKRVYGLKNVRVQCEGCTKKGDAEVTAGSCVVQFGISEIGHINPRRGARGAIGQNDGDIVGIIFFFIFTLAMVYVLMIACKSSKRHATEESSMYAGGGVYPGIALDAKGNPIHNGHYQPSQHHHHHHHGGGSGFGGGGFGTGMMTGFLVGDAMGRMSHHHGGGYGGGGYDDGGGADFGGGGFGDGGGFGGTDFV